MRSQDDDLHTIIYIYLDNTSSLPDINMIINNILKNDEKNAIRSEKQTHTRSGRLCLVSNFYQLRTTPKKKKKRYTIII